jgi:Rho family protein
LRAGIGAKYAECSAKQGHGVQELFTMAVQDSLKSKGLGKIKRKAKCVFM